jgi:hypothetical protein
VQIYGIDDRASVVIANTTPRQNMMKSSYLSIGLFSITTLSALFSLSFTPVSAQCVMNDTNIQFSMNGSRKPTDRSNDVTQKSSGVCVGNSVSSTNTQVQVGGTQRASQHRQSHQEIIGGNSSPTGINMKPVKVRTNVQIDVYNAADRLR